MDQDKPEVRAKLKELARLMGMPLAELQRKLADEDKTFVWIRRQLDWDIGQQIAALDIPGIYQRKEYKRQYPEGESAAHVVGFTNVEDKGQEGMELAFNDLLAGRAGSRRVIKDRMGRVVEGVGEVVPPMDGRDMQLSIDSKVQFFAYQKLRDQVIAHKAKAGSVVVLDAVTGEVLALANYPSYSPDKRQNLTGEQLRNRAMTDTFEPGSTMKPFTIGLALDTGRVKPGTLVDTTPGRLTITGSTISDTHNYGVLTVEGVIQKSSNVGTTKLAMQMPAREMWETFRRQDSGSGPTSASPARSAAACAPTRAGVRSSRPPCRMATACRPACSRWRVPTPCLRTTARSFRPPCSRAPPRRRCVRCSRRRRPTKCARCCRWPPDPGGTGQKAQTVGYSVGANRARRASRSARATPPTSTAPGSPAWRPSIIRASLWR